jgi:uncharacterized protein
LYQINYMNTPFVFGRLATGDDFTNRRSESQHLAGNFVSGINTILISPRRWGKSSLVKSVSDQISGKHKNIRIVSIDLFNVRSEEDFYHILTEKIIRSTASKIQEIAEIVKNFLKQWIPKISFSPDNMQEFSLGMDWKEVKQRPDEILDLAERIAESKGWKLIICFDEFQNIGYFTDSLAFQKILRSHWQLHQQVSYCLYGSKRHMLMEVFASPSMPFYKFGDLMFLNKISSEDWVPYITKRFSETGKSVTDDLARKIAECAECHPYYVQQLAQLCWLRCDRNLTADVIEQAIESLEQQLSLLFQNLTESLSTPQVNFLHALVQKEEKFSSSAIIQKYRLGSSANVSKIKQALSAKEIIDSIENKMTILDPIYKRWLQRSYFAGS